MENAPSPASSARCTTPASLDDVPDRAAHIVLSMLGCPRDINTMAKVSSRWRIHSTSNEVWCNCFRHCFPHDVAHVMSMFPLLGWKDRFKRWFARHQQWKRMDVKPEHKEIVIDELRRPVYCIGNLPVSRTLLASFGNAFRITQYTPSSELMVDYSSPPLEVGDANLMCVAVDECHRTLVCGSMDGSVTFAEINKHDCEEYSCSSAECKPSTVRFQHIVTENAHTAPVLSVALAPKVLLALSGSGDKTAILWQARTGKQLTSLRCPSQVYSCAMSSCGRLGITGDAEGNVIAWDVEGGRALRKYSGYDHWVWSMDFGMPWQGRCMKALKESCTAAAFIPESAAAAAEDHVMLAEMSLHKKPARRCGSKPAAAHAGAQQLCTGNSAAAKPVCGVRRACASFDRWTSAVLNNLCPAKRRAFTAAQQSPEPAFPLAGLVFTGNTDGCWRQFDLRMGECAASVYVDPSAITKRDLPVSCVQYHRRQEQLITTSYDGAVRLWDLRTMKVVNELLHPRKLPFLRVVSYTDAIVATDVEGSLHTWSFPEE